MKIQQFSRQRIRFFLNRPSYQVGEYSQFGFFRRDKNKDYQSLIITIKLKLFLYLQYIYTFILKNIEVIIRTFSRMIKTSLLLHMPLRDMKDVIFMLSNGVFMRRRMLKIYKLLRSLRLILGKNFRFIVTFSNEIWLFSYLPTHLEASFLRKGSTQKLYSS